MAGPSVTRSVGSLLKDRAHTKASLRQVGEKQVRSAVWQLVCACTVRLHARSVEITPERVRALGRWGANQVVRTIGAMTCYHAMLCAVFGRSKHKDGCFDGSHVSNHSAQNWGRRAVRL